MRVGESAGRVTVALVVTVVIGVLLALFPTAESPVELAVAELGLAEVATEEVESF